ncbi:MAG TPA: hypothetical protein VGQ81_15840 [Acidobacteriota bacterium]|jgi:NitT/TauT family transport system substrate-binding protein|nr:hypothetical protein [Acidobacteriota bacterium]
MAGVPIRIMVARHSTFYSPLIATLAAGFWADGNLAATYAVLPPGARSHDLIRRGEIDIMQSAVSTNWGAMEKGMRDLPVHFALINQRDGFFLVGRKPEAPFHWRHLEGRKLLVDSIPKQGEPPPQPLAMLRYAAHCQRLDWNKIELIDGHSPEEAGLAFRQGRGDYIHQQGPAPQQFERDGLGSIVAAVGDAMPPVAFSSLMASRAFLQTEAAKFFVGAYLKAKQWVVDALAEDVARAEASYFPGISHEALTASISRYQMLGCWRDGIKISRQLYEQALNVFEYCGAISRRHAYEEVVVSI